MHDSALAICSLSAKASQQLMPIATLPWCCALCLCDCLPDPIGGRLLHKSLACPLVVHTLVATNHELIIQCFSTAQHSTSRLIRYRILHTEMRQVTVQNGKLSPLWKSLLLPGRGRGGNQHTGLGCKSGAGPFQRPRSAASRSKTDRDTCAEFGKTRACGQTGRLNRSRFGRTTADHNRIIVRIDPSAAATQ